MKLFVSSVVRHNSVSVSQSSSRTALFTLFGFIRITSVNPTWFWMDPFWKFWNKISWFDFFTSQEPDVLTGVETFYFHCVFIQMSSTAEELVMSQNLKWSRCFQVLQSSLFSCMFFSRQRTKRCPMVLLTKTDPSEWHEKNQNQNQILHWHGTELEGSC